jgi:hypothetical protein
MEAFIRGRLVDGWSANENSAGFRRDQDASSMAVLKQKGRDVAKLFDNNSAISNWERSYEELQQILPPGKGNTKDQNALLRWNAIS